MRVDGWMCQLHHIINWKLIVSIETVMYSAAINKTELKELNKDKWKVNKIGFVLVDKKIWRG